MDLMHYNAVDSLFDSFKDEFNNLVVNKPAGMTCNYNTWSPRVDIQTKDDSYIIYADLPGVDSKDINVRMEGNILILDGQRREEKTEKNRNYTRTERFVGKFYRQFTLPENVNVDGISAKSKHGVLELTIPKGKEKAIKKIEITSEDI
jgi:HSP20 family protein